jgi:hypothetical protein
LSFLFLIALTVRRTANVMCVSFFAFCSVSFLDGREGFDVRCRISESNWCFLLPIIYSLWVILILLRIHVMDMLTCSIINGLHGSTLLAVKNQFTLIFFFLNHDHDLVHLLF